MNPSVPFRHLPICALIGAIALCAHIASGFGDVLNDAESAAYAAKRGDYQTAILFLNRVIDSGALEGWNLSQAFTRRADAHAAVGARRAALLDYDAALALADDNTDALVNRGLTHHELGQFGDAIADFNAALAHDPELIPARYNRALSLGAIGALRLAMDDLDAVLVAWPDFARAYNDRGVIYSEIGQVDRALRNFDTALRLQPNLAVAHFNRAVVYRRTGNLVESLADLDTAIALSPQDPEFLDMRGRVLFELDREPGAQDDPGRVRNIDPALCERLTESASLETLRRNLCE